MQVARIHDNLETDVELALSDDTTVGDVAVALFADEAAATTRLSLDGRRLDYGVPVVESGLGTGAVISLTEAADSRERPVARLTVLCGPGAGMSLSLPTGRHSVGSAPGSGIVVRAPGVRPHHGYLEIGAGGTAHVQSTPSGEPAAAGSPLLGPLQRLHPDAFLRIGEAILRCRPITDGAPTGSSCPGRRGTVSFNRPPRDIRRRSERPVALPERPKPPSQRGPVSVVMLITPIVFGVAMAILIHPRMAMFAALAPLTVIGHKIDGRRKQRKFARESAIENAHNAELLAVELAKRRAREVVRRRTTYPAPAELVERAARPTTTLWERRPRHEDFMQLVCGYGYDRWLPEFDRDPLTVADELIETMRSSSALPLAPLTVAMTAGQVLGLAGQRTGVLDLARGLICQAAILHGPSDLEIAVVTEHPTDWNWIKWLPHAVLDSAAGRRLLASSNAEIVQLVAALTPCEPVTAGGARALLGGETGADSAGASPPLTLLIVDVDDLAAARFAGVRNLLGGRGLPVCGLAITSSQNALPSVCTRTVIVHDRTAELCGGPSGDVMIAPAGAVESVAARCARALARFDDPDRSEDGAELPACVHLVDLLGIRDQNPQLIAARWAAAGHKPRLRGLIGVTEAGPLELDLVADGPHGLLAGTTGAGKSELLRTLVVSMAVAVDPEHLNFVLIDYKGGSAFDACAGLPHTVGMVTDLDDHLAERALTCLEAELRYREHLLRSVGADDVAAYLDLDLDEPLPRMVIVIDEFAAMAKELPEFMDALVDIAARGRSLGIHLLLATQRPAGVIRDNIRANTNLRIALRVQDTGDSMDVLNDRRAATIGRSQPGRGFLRLGATEVVPFQTALVTGHAFDAASASMPVAVRPFVFAMDPPPFPEPNPPGRTEEGPTDLEILVGISAAAAHTAGMRPPRLPWPEALPLHVSRTELRNDPVTTAATEPADGIAIGLQDEPDRQRQTTFRWAPGDGNLVAFGNVGTGTTTTLATIGLGLAEIHSPASLHIYVLDFDTGGLAPLAELPHVGAVVLPGERDRQLRLIRMLNQEVSLRKGKTAAAQAFEEEWPAIVVLIDGFDGFKTEYDIGADSPVRDAMLRVVTEGPAVGIVSVISGMRVNSLLPQMAATIPNKLVFRMADPLAAGGLGLRGIPADLPPGRCHDAVGKREIQIAAPDHEDLRLAVADLDLDPWIGDGGPRTVDNLPAEVKVSALNGAIHLGAEEWFIPIGVGDTDLDIVGVALGEGDHLLIAGESRSGRSTLLATVAALVAGNATRVSITAITPRRSPLRDQPDIDLLVTDPGSIDDAMADIVERAGPQLVLVDDVEMIEKSTVLAELATSRRPDLHVVAAGRRDLKRQYSHWANSLTRSRKGVWLQPSPGLDGDLWSTPMPRNIALGMPPGRGYLIGDGVVELVQTARPA